MIKPQQRVIRKGHYYQIQAYQQTMILISKTKKQQSTNTNPNSTTNIHFNQHIITHLPNFHQARHHYLKRSINPHSHYQLHFDQLVHQLELIINQQPNLTDQDRNQIEMLTHQIIHFANSNQLLLNSLPQPKQPPQQAKQTPTHPHTSVTLTAQYNIASLSNRITQLQQLDFPQLISLQHQLQIMLGEKKPLQSLELGQMDQKQKQEVNNVYNHLNSLSIMKNTQRVIQQLYYNERKHSQMEGWVGMMEQVTKNGNDMMYELREDREVLKRLQQNFEQNMRRVREVLKGVRGEK